MSRSLFVVALLCLSACRPDPEDLFFIVGEVVDPTSQTPVAGAPVVLERLKGNSSCMYGQAHETPYEPQADAGTFTTLLEAETDAEGRYLFELMRFQVNANDGYPYCLRISYDLPGEEGVTRITTFAGLSDLQAPALLHWSPALAVESAGAALTVTRPPLPLEPSPPLDVMAPIDYAQGQSMHGYEWELRTDAHGPVWREEAVGTLTLTPEMREDFSAAVALQLYGMTTKVTGALFQTADYFTLAHKPQPVNLSPGALVPVSRGAACSDNVGALSPCPMTDGDLALAPLMRRLDDGADPNFPSYTYPYELFLHLDAPRTLRHVVLRDVFFGTAPGAALVIAGSNDLEAWTELGRTALPVYQELVPVLAFTAGGGLYLSWPLGPGAGAFQHLRFSIDSSDNTGSFYGIRELSLFE